MNKTYHIKKGDGWGITYYVPFVHTGRVKIVTRGEKEVRYFEHKPKGKWFAEWVREDKIVLMPKQETIVTRGVFP